MNLTDYENPYIRKAMFHLTAMKGAFTIGDLAAIRHHDEQCRIANQRIIIWAYTKALTRDFIETPGGRNHE